MPEPGKRTKQTIYTLGHSDLTFETFLARLRKSAIQILADIRTIPKSKYIPQFDQAALKERLPSFGITYHHLKEVGGKGRKPLRRSPNKGLPKAWQAYADYMQSEEFERGLMQLLALVSIGTVVLLCSEKQWDKCHRKLLADALLVRGYTVVHLDAEGNRVRHTLTPGMEIKKNKITYPAMGEQLTLF